MAGFEGLLGDFVARVLRSIGYSRPTPVQEKAIPAILSGNNVLVVAPTGSGKTEAALFPVFKKLAGSRPGAIKAVYVTPLRSLNRDIFTRMSLVGRALGIQIEVRHGDSSAGEKRRFLKNPPHVMITTPESFYFLLSVPEFRRAIRELRYVIVDEAHEILASKRGAELSLAIERVEKYYTRQRLQIIGLSATVAKPRFFARRLFSWRSYVVVEDLQRKIIKVDVDGHSSHEKVVELVARYVASSKGKVIVFVNTRDTAEVIGARLKEILGEKEVEVHHGSLSRDLRLRVEEEFKKGRVKAVVATSSLELGIDVGSVDLVIQYMSPRQVVKLTQRVGRAGHGYGAPSRGVIVSTPNLFDVLESAVIAARASRGNLEETPFYAKPFDALIHQVVGTVLELGEVQVNELYELVTRSAFYRDMSIDEMEALLGFMEYIGVIRVRNGVARPGRRARSYYYQTTMIPDTRQYSVIDIETSKKIGILDEEFVATLDRGNVFVLSGNVWEVVSVDDNAVRVKRTRSTNLLPPSWEGDLIPVEYGVAREVASILRRLRKGCDVLDSYPLSSALRDHVCKVVKDAELLPGDDTLLVEHYRDTLVLHVSLGSRGNMAFEYLLAALVEDITGYPPETTSTPYVVALRVNSRDAVHLARNLVAILRKLGSDEVEELVVRSLRRSRVYKWTLLHVALRSGAVSRDAKLSEVKRLISALSETPLGSEALKEIRVKKVDIGLLEKFLLRLKKGEVKVVIRDREGFSRLALEALGESRFPERLRSQALPSTVLSEVVKRKILKRRIILVCMRCGATRSVTIGALPERPRCESCGSGLLAPVYSEEEAKNIKKIILKVKRGKKLSRGERETLRRYMEAADLVLSYGRKAIEALSYTGVGPATARSVLQKLVFGEHQFYRALVEAEARYHQYKHKLRKNPQRGPARG